jgi:hypothetical protein
MKHKKDALLIIYSNMTSKPVVKIILIYDRLNL